MVMNMNNEFHIKINTIERAKNLVDICCSFDCDIDVICGRYIVDAKSIMGIFSLDLRHDLIIKIHSMNESEIKYFNERLSDFKI